MKIGILTQPLHNNYGGLLQNYALQIILKNMGHEVYTININRNNNKLFKKVLSYGKRVLLNIAGKKITYRVYPTKEEAVIISKNTKAFIDKYINTTCEYRQKITSQILKEYDFDVYIVGSDQVWRPRYSPQMPTYFLDFITKDHSPKKIAYAASFGTSDLEFSHEEILRFSAMIKLFNAVSVREDSAVKLCKKHFDVDAIHLVDPTMLLTKEFYSKFVSKCDLNQSPGNLYTYILDKSLEKSELINNIAGAYNLTPFTVMPKKLFSDPCKKNINDCIFPPVEQWIKGFMDAKFVVTDSFHGTVFSILFNKPFISIANSSRGLTRFESLLKLFTLENKLLVNLSDFNLNSFTKSDYNWNTVNSILEREREKARMFLENSLKS